MISCLNEEMDTLYLLDANDHLLDIWNASQVMNGLCLFTRTGEHIKFI